MKKKFIFIFLPLFAIISIAMFFLINEKKEEIKFENIVKVAILDSGFKSYDNKVKIEKGISFISDDKYDDLNGHGTEIANLIYNSNSSTQLYIAQVLDEDSNGYEKDIIAGVEWAIEQGVDIINMSVSSYQYSEDFKKVIDNAINKGIIIVAPVGNDNPNGGISYPAKFENVLAIGSVNSKLEHSSFSNSGPEIDFVIEGEDIEVTSIYGLIEKNSGTSISAAKVTGIISNLLMQNRDLTYTEIIGILKKKSITKGNRNLYGNGIIKEDF